MQPTRGEAVALVIDDSHRSVASAVVATFEHASPAAPIVADLGQCVDTGAGRHQADDLPGFLANLDNRLRQADRVLAVVPASDPHLGGLLRHMDRAVLLTSRATATKLAHERLSGLTPPVERETQRLVDGVTISPVPTAALKDMGADITVSVNLMAREELDRWSEDDPAFKVEKERSKTLDPMIETLIMLPADTSVRNAAEADVVISPKFAPSSWRDIHWAGRFEAAGRREASEPLTKLHALASPQNVLNGA